MKTSLTALVASLLVVPFAHAAEVDDAPAIVVKGVLANDDTPINPVRLPQSARISSQTLTAEDVNKRQARDVYDLLNYGTGVFTVTSGKKAPATLNIRGDSNFAFIIDGAYMPQMLASRVLQTMPADAIEEVRIVRSSTALTISPLVGFANPSGAPNNGFIVVRTRTPGKTEAAIRLFGGSFNTLGANARAGTAITKGDLKAYVQVIGADYTTDGPTDFNLDKVYKTAGIKAGLEMGIASLDLSWMKSWGNYGIVAGNAKLQPSSYTARWRMEPMDSSVATANATLRWNSHNTTLMTLAYTDSTGALVTRSTTSTAVTTNPNNNSFLNAALRHNLFLGSTKIQAGVDFIHWKNPTGQYFYEGRAREEKASGIFLQADQALLGGRLNLDLGGRIDRVRIVKGIDYYVAGRAPAANVRQILNYQMPDAKFVSAGASLRITRDLLVNARYAYSAQGVRPGVVLANPLVPLKGETRNKFEVGFEARLTDWLRPSANAFFIKPTNEGAAVSTATVGTEQVTLYGNTDSKRTGAEFVLGGRWGEGESSGGYRASATHYFSVLDPTGLLARTQPKTVAELTADQSWHGWRLAGAVKYVSGYTSNAFTACTAPNLSCTAPVTTAPFLPVGDFVNVDLALSHQITIGGQAMRVTGSVKNLTDKNYETSVGYPSIGRQFGLEVQAQF